MYSKISKFLFIFLLLGNSAGCLASPTDSLFLTIDELFRLGTENSLKIQADLMKESIAHEQSQTARTSRLPDLQIGLKGGVVGQPIVFQRGLSSPTYPDTPDWMQNYAVDFTQPLYQGGKIHYSIRKADLQRAWLPCRLLPTERM